MSASGTIAAAAVALVVTLTATLGWVARSRVTEIGFWFADDVTYEVADPRRFGSALTSEEQATIKRLARREVEQAFSPFRVRVTDRRDAFYSVNVRQVLRTGGPMQRASGAAGQSHVFGFLGGAGAVSFYMVAAQALINAPVHAARADIVDGMGRGLGRTAVHEFVHQILPHGPAHSTDDRASYEYWTSDRPAQYYGEMHWSVARDALADRLGLR